MVGIIILWCFWFLLCWFWKLECLKLEFFFVEMEFGYVFFGRLCIFYFCFWLSFKMCIYIKEEELVYFYLKFIMVDDKYIVFGLGNLDCVSWYIS